MADQYGFKLDKPMDLADHASLPKGKIGDRFLGFINADLNCLNDTRLILVVHNASSELSKREEFRHRGEKLERVQYATKHNQAKD